MISLIVIPIIELWRSGNANKAKSGGRPVELVIKMEPDGLDNENGGDK